MAVGTAEVRMPKLSESMTEGKVLHWAVGVGDFVSAGDVLGEVETDKANMELEASEPGYVAEILVPVGSVVPVGTPLIRLVSSLEELGDRVSSPHIAVEAAEASCEVLATTDLTSPEREGREQILPNVSPVAEELAQQLGLDLNAIVGSGPGGRIMKQDVLRAAARHRSSSENSATRDQTAIIELPELTEHGTISEPSQPVDADEELHIVPVCVETVTLRSHIVGESLIGALAAILNQMQLTHRLHWDDLLPLVAGRAYAIALKQAQSHNLKDSFSAEAVAGTIAIGVGPTGGRRYPLLHSVAALPLSAIITTFAELREKALAGTLRSEECRGAQLVVESLGTTGAALSAVHLKEGSSPVVFVSRICESELSMSLVVRASLETVGAWSEIHDRACLILRNSLLLAECFENCEQ